MPCYLTLVASFSCLTRESVRCPSGRSAVSPKSTTGCSRSIGGTASWTKQRSCTGQTCGALGVSEERLDEAVPLIEEVIVKTPWTAVEGAVQVLRILSAAGYRLGVIENAFGTVGEELAGLGIRSVAGGSMPQVSIVVDSHHVSVEKPDPRIFGIALEALEVPPSRAISVGDTVRFDVLGAAAAGMHPVHMDPFGLCQGDRPHIERLSDLAQWCGALP